MKQKQLSLAKNHIISFKRKKPSWFLKIIAVAIAIPVISIIMLLSLVVSERQWSEFWDEFL